MSHLNREIAILLASCLLASCGRLGFSPSLDLAPNDCPDAGSVCIRVENTSAIDFDSFDVHFPDQVEQFGGLRAGQISTYRKIGRAYRYAYTEAFSGERRFVLQPIDYVGEKFVPPGNYTYQFSVNVMDEPQVWGDSVLHGYMGVELKSDEGGT